MRPGPTILFAIFPCTRWPPLPPSTGPWQWEARESYWYGDHLNSRPAPGLRLRIHMYPQTVQDGAGTLTGLRDKGYMALLELDSQKTSATREEIDAALSDLLTKLRATQVTAIEPYD